MEEQRLTWIPAYEAIATALLDYESHQKDLAAIASEVLDEHYDAMDPLTFFSVFNGKKRNEQNRIDAVKMILNALGLDVAPAKDFWGIPITNALNWKFWGGGSDDIENNWAVFKAALQYADNPSDEIRTTFIERFNISRAQKNNGDAKLTMALFWIRPAVFLPLDNNTRTFLRNRYSLQPKIPIDGAKYLELIENVHSKETKSFAEISFCAWEKGGWVPAPYDYNPSVTTEQWSELLKDPGIGTPNTLITLKCLNEHPDGATCTELFEFYGRVKEFYNSNVTALGKKVAERLDIKLRDEEGAGIYWPIVCYGSYVRPRRHGSFAWKLREEVREALKGIDLSDLPLAEDFSIEVPEFDAERFKRLIALYKDDYYRFRGPVEPEGDHEVYKWDDLLAYRQNWDLEAEDFKEHMIAALKPAATGQGALLGSGYEYPFRILTKLAEFDQEAVREAFRSLYDSDAGTPLAYANFVNAIETLLDRYNEQAEAPLDEDHQNSKAASLYLFFEQPEKHHFYKQSVADSLAGCIGVKLPGDSLKSFFIYEALCDALMHYVTADEKLIELNDSVLTPEQRSADPAHHLLLQDIAYYSDTYMKSWHPDWEALLDAGTDDGEEDNVPKNYAPVYPKNMILYGPPGTGKTYQTKAYAVAICDGKSVEAVLAEMKTDEGYERISKRYMELRKEKRIGFTTFHQSYGYEDFIEGIRPEYDEEDGKLKYPVRDGVFLEFCEAADITVKMVSSRRGIPTFPENSKPRVWKMGLSTNGTPYLQDKCRKEGCLRLGFDEIPYRGVAECESASLMNKRATLAFEEDMKPGDFAVIPGVAPNEYGVAVITGDCEWREDLGSDMRYRTAQWLPNVNKAKFIELNGGKMLTLQTVYELTRVSASDLLELMGFSPDEDEERADAQPYVFIIDEINRGNVAKIFGELITLLEPEKRKGEREMLTVDLPYSGKKDFSVPSNVYVIGTMNTADRSITQLDTALRRRFDFIEVMPDSAVLGGIDVDGVDIPKMLDVMNKRISVLYDREHTLGHAYLIGLREDSSIERLASIFKNKLIPLLQEYFFDDYAKIRSVLGAAADEFIEAEPSEGVFWDGDENADGQLQVYVVKRTPDNPGAYIRIYDSSFEG